MLPVFAQFAGVMFFLAGLGLLNVVWLPVFVHWTGASFLFYGNGVERLAAALGSDEAKQEKLAGVVGEIRVEKNWRRQSALVRSLGSFGAAGQGFLVELLRDEDPDLREYAAVTLRDFPSETAFEALVVLGNPEGLPAVLRCLSDEHSWVREEATIALLRIGSEEAVPALERAVDDENREVRLCAAEVLKRLR